jgi:hypothetical protein
VGGVHSRGGSFKGCKRGPEGPRLVDRMGQPGPLSSRDGPLQVGRTNTAIGIRRRRFSQATLS